MTMTSDLSSKERKNTALRAVIVSLITLLFFGLTGQIVFKFFGISINGLRIVGGVLFFAMGWEMLQARLSRMKIGSEEAKEYVDDISVTPLAIPMISGPGAITNSIVLMQDANSWALKGTLIVTLIVLLAIVYITLLSSARIMKVIGETGNKVMMRLMGLVIMVIAVEFFFAGLKPYINQLVNG